MTPHHAAAHRFWTQIGEVLAFLLTVLWAKPIG
jgi:hypothetical protein